MLQHGLGIHFLSAWTCDFFLPNGIIAYAKTFGNMLLAILNLSSSGINQVLICNMTCIAVFSVKLHKILPPMIGYLISPSSSHIRHNFAIRHNLHAFSAFLQQFPLLLPIPIQTGKHLLLSRHRQSRCKIFPAIDPLHSFLPDYMKHSLHNLLQRFLSAGHIL